MRAVAGKTTLSYGDTTSLTLQWRNPDGPWTNKPGDWSAMSSIVQADTFGFLYTVDSSKVDIVIIDTSTVLDYYAKAETEPDSIEVLIQLMSQETGSPPVVAARQNARSKSLPQQQPKALQFKVSARGAKKTPAKILGGGVPGGAIHYGLARLKVRKSEILLGETKYYYVKDEGDGNRSVEETTDPSRNPGVQQDVWQGSPVTVVIDKPSAGKKLGVYWEKRKPDGMSLPVGMMRLIGRYWYADSVYKVNLTATYDGAPSRTVEVKKPAKLGDTHNAGNDVHLKPFNLDSLIIYYAGNNGVLPQYLKALVSKETMGYFDPCYRYEPFKDIQELQVKDKKTLKYAYESIMYRILNADDKGMPAIPTDHVNVRDASKERVPYPGYQKLWDYYWNHISFYGLNHYSGNNDFEKYWEQERKKIPKELFNKAEAALSSTERQAASDSTDARFFRWIRYEYDGGMENMVAQTRICASYGLLQLVYYGGTPYPQNDGQYRPEDISDHPIGFRYGVQHLIGKFNKKSVLNGHFAESTWQSGLELKYKEALGQWNLGRGYADDVISRVPQFLPKH